MTNASMAQQWQFPSLSTTYCAPTDRVCAPFFARNTTWRDFSDTSFCRGADGCVVVSACEARAIGRDQCELSSPATGDPLVLAVDFSWLTGLVAGIVVVSVLLLLGGLWCLYRWCTRSRRRCVRLDDGDVALKKTQVIRSGSVVSVDIQNVSLDASGAKP
ncbi:hypothetical protein PINS_up010358 [Pythium insidiosum]|nr:hypothetical protein PINS_up010358 [Pythium insidiosum]